MMMYISFIKEVISRTKLEVDGICWEYLSFVNNLKEGQIFFNSALYKKMLKQQ